MTDVIANLGINFGTGVNSGQFPNVGGDGPGQSFQTIPLSNQNLVLYQLSIRDFNPPYAAQYGYTFPLSPTSITKEFTALTNIYDVADLVAENGGVQRIVDPYGHCFSQDTEILTREGWKTFDLVTVLDQIATRNINRVFEWQLPTHVTWKPYKGEMYHFNTTSVDMFVTPEHRMLLAKTKIHDRRKNGKYVPVEKDERVEITVEREYIEEARNVGAHTNIRIPVTSTWRGKSIESHTFNCEARTCPPKTITVTGNDFCALVGAYVAEGNLRVQGGIEIAQQTFSKGFLPYKALCARLSLTGEAQHNGKSFILPYVAMTDYFKQFGHAHQKHVPEEIMNSTPEQIKIFLDFYGLGDGNFISKFTDSKKRRTRITYTTVSKKLADQLQELVQKIGMSASITKRFGGKQLIMGRLCDTRDSYKISVLYTKNREFNVTTKQFDGYVGCVTVPNTIIYVRRNGKAAWSGNSLPSFALEGTTGWQFHGTDGFQFTGLQSIAVVQALLNQYAQLNRAQQLANKPLYPLEYYDYYSGEFWQVVPIGPQTVRQTSVRPLLFEYAFKLAAVGPPVGGGSSDQSQNDAAGNAFGISGQQGISNLDSQLNTTLGFYE